MSGDATIANTGALTLANTAVTPAAYTVNGQALLTVDSKGRITAASNATVTAVPSGSAWRGLLTGTYPNPTLVTTAVTAASYTVNGQALFTVDAKGRLTSASNATVTAAPSGSAGGDLGGTYPNPSVLKINGVSLVSTTATAGNLLIGSGTAWVTNAMSGDATINSTGVLTLTNTAVTPAAYTVNGQALFTVDSKGRITSASNATVTGTITAVNQISTSSATLANNSRYSTNNGASLVTYTIPAGASVWRYFDIIVGWIIRRLDYCTTRICTNTLRK